ncbi:hypothetical protein G3O08_17390 [Cryomorpha ignava]|uniref:Uncharacterized protein n=1 Tax=Cryomorpha ignava TaxID=101383 RepID=A0A7K3WUT9_9FLAO|nr:hypothetical protein [Cryomorpha ignava]NEN25274.1 hypothetical protein [Cryomorpha ignava]
MDFEFEIRWKETIAQLEKIFGGALELEGILFLIGVQALGQGTRKFKKDEKLDLIHIAICTILTPYGYYEFSHYDTDKWPHFENVKKLPFLNDNDQKLFMRRAIVDYFEKENIIDLQE